MRVSKRLRVPDRLVRGYWPAEGAEPDPRWSLANERTMLAYTRTALGFVVTGLAVAGSHRVADAPLWLAAVGIPIIAIGAMFGFSGRHRFAKTQRAMRMGEPLPPPTSALLLPLGIGVVGFIGTIVAIIYFLNPF